MVPRTWGGGWRSASESGARLRQFEELRLANARGLVYA
jgi:hypothetical protein